jgi:thiol-disulfide isomerase/thioredoxin
MKNTVFSFFLLVTLGLQAQYAISGTFMPAKDYKWLIAYRLKPGTQNYIAQTKVQNGVFSLKIPENSLPGTYRLVYAVPQEKSYFDVIYNGKEDISLAFDSRNGVSYLTSNENIFFNTYFKEIIDLEQQIVDFYVKGSTNEQEYFSITKQMRDLQNSYELKSKGLMANHFIKSNKPYIPRAYQSVNDYVNGKTDAYFNTLEIDNPILQASGFLTNKLVNFVFTALPLETTTLKERQKTMIANVDIINKKTATVNIKYKAHLFYTLWAQASASDYNTTSDYIYNTYLKMLATETGNQEIVNQIEAHNRLRLGAIAPEIKWQKNGVQSSLSSLDGAENYIIVFWSSTCSHCLRELPTLHNKLKNNRNIKVVAVGLEDDDSTWTQESARMPHFNHSIALGKWESEYADLYAIDKTPTYFILDQDKRIIAKPESDKEIIDFLKNK